MKVLIALLLCTSTLCWANSKQIRVFVTDSGVDISHLEIRKHINIGNWEKEDYIDTNFHGTHIAGLILKDVCDEVELISCKFTPKVLSDHLTSDNLSRSIECFKKAINQHIDILNYSAGGHEFSQEEFDVLKSLRARGTRIVVAAGNDGQDLTKFDYYPAKYKIPNMVVVGNLDVNEVPYPSSNFNLPGMVWEIGTNISSTFPANSYGIMTGSSQSTAIRTNKMLKELCNVRH